MAYNLWRARRAERENISENQRTARGRLFARNWQLDYRGYPAEDRWESEAARRLRAKIEQEKARRQQRPANDLAKGTKRVMNIICDLCWVRFAQLPADQRPQGGKEGMMLCLQCFNGVGNDQGHRQPSRDGTSVKRPAVGADGNGIRDEASCKRRAGGGLSGGSAAAAGRSRPSSVPSCVSSSSCSSAAPPTTACSAVSSSAAASLAPRGNDMRTTDKDNGADGPGAVDDGRDPLTVQFASPIPRTSHEDTRTTKRLAPLPGTSTDGTSSDSRADKVRRCAKDPGAVDVIPLPTVTRAQKAEGYLQHTNLGNVAEFSGKRRPSGDAAFADHCTEIDMACKEAQCHPGAASSSDNLSQCPTCQSVHKPSRFRRVPEGTTWRGATAGTMVCNRCHLHIRWGRP